jgi:hypothetical protein
MATVRLFALLAAVGCSPDYPGVPERVRPECGTGDRSLGAFCCGAEECDSGVCRDAVCTKACTFNEDCGSCDAAGCDDVCLVVRDVGSCWRTCAVHPEICEGDTECRLVSEMPDLDLEHETNYENVEAERVACFRAEAQ